VQAHPAVLAGDRTGTRPQHLTGRGEFVEHRGGVVPYPRREDERLEGAGRDREPGELVDDGGDAVDAAQPAADVVPRG
jgi:hypothetical protein